MRVAQVATTDTSVRDLLRPVRALAGPRSRRPVRVAHLTTVDMSLALLLAAELAVDLEAGFDVYGISAPGPYVADIRALGAEHAAVPALTRAWDLRSDLVAAGQLWRVLRDMRPDVLHTHTPKAGVLGRIVGRAAGVPIVVNTCHGLWAAPGDPWSKRALVYLAEAAAAAFSDAELYQNDADRRALRRLGVRRQRVVGNGIDLTRFGPDPQARARVRAELNVTPGTVVVGGVGRRVTEKGVGEFVAAARALRGQARFVWVGPPDDYGRAHAVEDGEASVQFLGLRHDMEAIYAALDVFTLPSHREGFSRSAMEAAATGCAMVLTDIRGCREIGRDGRELLMVPPRDSQRLTDAIGRLIHDPQLRDRLGAAARARALHRFDQRRVAQASIEVYRAVAARKRLPRVMATGQR